MRRGWVWPIRPPPLAPAAAQRQRDLRQLGGLARAGLAADDDAWWSRIAAAISSRRAETGSDSGKSIGGIGVGRAARRGRRGCRIGAGDYPGGLPHLSRAIVKFVLPLTRVVLPLQGLVEIVRCAVCLRQGDWPLRAGRGGGQRRKLKEMARERRLGRRHHRGGCLGLPDRGENFHGIGLRLPQRFRGARPRARRWADSRQWESMSVAADSAVESIWRDAGLDPTALRSTGRCRAASRACASSFAVSTAAQASLGAAALAATEIGRVRNGLAQAVSVDLVDAALECTGRFTLDGVAPQVWDKIAGLYRCGPADDASGSACTPTSRTTATALLRLLGLPEGAGDDARAGRAPRSRGWRADDARGPGGRARPRRRRAAQLRRVGPASAGAAVAGLPLVRDRAHRRRARRWLGRALAPTARAARRPARARPDAHPRRPGGRPHARRLRRRRAARQLADLPNIDAIADTSRGKRSALADLRDSGRPGRVRGGAVRERT